MGTVTAPSRRAWHTAAMREIPVLAASELDSSQALRRHPVPVDLDGTEAVVWRAVDGTIGVVARACPHLDWDLSEATITDIELVCPGHGWSITCSGRVFKRNEFGREDAKGSTPHWPAREQDGKIWVEIGQT